MSFGVNAANYNRCVASPGPVLTALDQSGFGFIRLSILWGWTERKQGVIDWEVMDAAIDKTLSVHVTPLVVITGPTPCWSLQQPMQGCNKPQNQLPRKQAWSNFVSAVVSRYKNRVQYWEIWNEPNLTQSLDIPDLNQRLAGYRDQILIPGAEAVHVADSSAKVVGPTFASNTFNKRTLADATKVVLQPPAAELIDVVSFHCYFPADANGNAIEIRNVMRSFGIGTKPIWLTETGLSMENLGGVRYSGMGDVESRQVNFFRTDVLNVLASGNIQRVFWFAMTDSRDMQGNHIDHYGLVDDSGKMRPAFTELKRVIHNACQ